LNLTNLSLKLDFQAVCWQLNDMINDAVKNSKISVKKQTFQGMRKSRCAQKSFGAELKRLHAMSIEDRVREALGMQKRFSWLSPTQYPR